MRSVRYLTLWVTILVAIFPFNVGSRAAAQLPTLYRINAPYLPDGIYYRHTAVAWLGQATPDENYSDVRVGYDNSEIFIHVATFDRRLWYDTSPSPADLVSWDAITIYLNKDGNIGNTLTADAYRFDGQLNGWESRASWQTSYRGNNGQWVTAPMSFTTATDSAWESPTVGGLNVDQNNRGWIIEFRIPFNSLGMSAPPQGTIWGLGVAVHDRDSTAGPSRADKAWPVALNGTQPVSWGQLRFGLPVYAPDQPAISRGQTMVRQGLNGASVPDAQVGGWTNCGRNVTDYFAGWGSLNYAGGTIFNVQNQTKLADWPCFAKYYVTFPLGSVPAGKVIVSATVTLRQFGNAGEGWSPGPKPSFIQVLSVNDDWSENTLTWNNAPRARENLGELEVDPLVNPGYPGVPRTWDISRAVAEAYAAGAPVRLAFYSADSDMHSGRYFYTSDFTDAAARPTLVITWGDPIGSLKKSVWPATVAQNDQVTYTLSLLGTGQPMTLTDVLPADVSQPGQINATGGTASYNAAKRQLTWIGTIAAGQPITLTFPVTNLLGVSGAIVNEAVLTDTIAGTSTASATFIANATRVWLPVVKR
jgi:hypothetical protein